MDEQRAAVACENCGDVFVGHVSSDGSIRPIGVDACSCGGTTFGVIEAARDEEMMNNAGDDTVIGGDADSERA